MARHPIAAAAPMMRAMVNCPETKPPKMRLVSVSHKSARRPRSAGSIPLNFSRIPGPKIKK